MTFLTSYKPHNYRKRWNSIWDDFFTDVLMPARQEMNTDEVSDFVPRFDIEETDNSYLFKGELPGIDKDNISVEINNHMLNISGEKKYEHETNEANYHRREMSYGSFRRTFQLPENIDPESVEAEYTKGILTLRVSKTDVKDAKRIEIK